MSVPIAEGVFTWPSDEPQLIGSRCARVRDRHVPRPGLVPALRVHGHGRAPAGAPGPAVGVDDAELPAAVAALPGPTGTRLRAVRVGYVELPGEVKVETRLTESDPERLETGMEMELAVVPFRTDEDGNEVVTFAFRPVAESERAERRHGRTSRSSGSGCTRSAGSPA